MEFLRSRNRVLVIRSIQTPTPDTTKLLRETRLAANYVVRDARLAIAKESMTTTDGLLDVALKALIAAKDSSKRGLDATGADKSEEEVEEIEEVPNQGVQQQRQRCQHAGPQTPRARSNAKGCEENQAVS